MAGPAKQFDPERALMDAMERFWERGYEATTMEDLVGCMGVNRASLYSTFGGKRSLYKLALRRYCERSLTWIDQCLSDAASPLGAVVGFIEELGREAGKPPRRGCLALSTAMELGPHDPELAGIVRDYFLAIEARIADALERAGARGELAPGRDARRLARTISGLIQALTAMSKAGEGPDALGMRAADMVALLR